MMKLSKKNSTKFLIDSSIKERHNYGDFVLLKSNNFAFCTPLNSLPPSDDKLENIYYPELLDSFSGFPSDVEIENISFEKAILNIELKCEVLFSSADEFDSQALRNLIISYRYYIQNQFVVLGDVNNQFVVKISSAEGSQLFKINSNVLIKFFGKNIPSISDLGGQNDLIDWYESTLRFSVKNKDLLDKYGIKNPTGLLLIGPPGTGKTTFAKIIATDFGAPIYSITPSDIAGKLVGTGESFIKSTFETARKQNFAIIFIDEVDAICLQRSEDNQNHDKRTISLLLSEMDGLKGRTNVLIIGATNRVELIDKAFLRPGRFSNIINMPLPNKEGILEILKIKSKKFDLSETINFDIISDRLMGFSGADIEDVTQRAGMISIKKSILEQREIITETSDYMEAIDEFNKRLKLLKNV